MSEYRKGRKRFISRDPSKANNNNQWKEEYNGRVITTGATSTTVASTSKNAANNYLHQPTFDLRTSDPATSDLYAGSSPSTRLSSLKQPRSTRHTSSPSSTSLRSEYHSTSRPSGDDRQTNDVCRSRDRSALRVTTVDAKTRIGADRRMASEMGFRPILRRHGTSSSSSGCESPSLKDNGIITSASSKTSLCPAVTIPDLRPAPATSIPTISAMTQRTESGTQKSQTHPGTFLTLPANADSMQVQIKDTRISITRVPDQVPGATTRLRTLSAEYDNVPEPSASSSASTKQVVSVPQSVPPAFAPSYESPGKLSPVRGLRLVPSPNSAFTKTKTSKASTNTDVQFQSEYSDWTMPALSLGSSRGPLEPDQRSTNASLTGQLNTTTVFDQTPIDFSLIFSGIGLRPLDLEYPVPEKQRTFRALKSCSLESIAVADVESGKTSGRTNRVSANESSIGKAVTNKNDAPPISKTTSQSSAFVSQTSSRDNQSKPKRILTEAEIRPQKNYSTSRPITDVFAIIGQHPSVVQQPIRNSVAKPSSSLALEARIDPFTKFSKKDLQPITDGPVNLFTSTVVQPITNSKQHYLAGSVGPITSSSKADQPINCSVTSTRSVTGPASRPITISTTSFGKVNVSTYILPPSLESTTSTAPLHFPLPLPYAPRVAEDEEVLVEPTMASAMSSLEMAISMLNSVAMDTSAPGVAMTILSTIATDTESLAKSFQLEAGAVGTDPIDYHEKPSDGREVVLPPPPPPHALTMDGRPDSLRSGSTTDVVAAALPRETFEYPVREDAVLTLTLNLLDQTLAEIHQEFPPGRRPSAGKTPRTEVTSSTTTAPTSHPALSRLPETTTSSSKTMPWDSSPPAQPRNSTTLPDVHRDAFGSRMTAEINDPDRYLRRILDRQDSFNRPGSSLFPETLPLPKDSVLQRYRRKKKTKSSASSSSSSSSSSSTSSSSRDEGEGNGAAGAKRSPRIGRRQTRRQRMNIRSEDGAAAAAAPGAGGESKAKTR